MSITRISALAAFLCAFLLSPSTSQAGPRVEFVAISTQASTNAPICESLTACQYPDPMFADAQQPAIAFDLDADQVVHLEADVFDGLGCGFLINTAVGDLPLAAGHVIVFLRFDPPLDVGTQLSLVWRVGACATDCSDYTAGVDPGICL